MRLVSVGDFLLLTGVGIDEGIPEDVEDTDAHSDDTVEEASD